MLSGLWCWVGVLAIGRLQVESLGGGLAHGEGLLGGGLGVLVRLLRGGHLL